MTTNSLIQTKPDRLLWLTHERLPHPDAEICPVDEEQVRLVIGLLLDTHERRMGILNRLQQISRKIVTLAPSERPSIPARMPNGLYEPISWRLAVWLCHALSFNEQSVRERLACRLEYWLSEGNDCDCLSLSETLKQNTNHPLIGSETKGASR